MRLSTLLGKTLRQPPSDAHLTSHQLLVRAAFARATTAGQFAYLPLGLRAVRRLESLLQHHLQPLNCQEIAVPLLPDTEEMENLIQLIRHELDSHRQLPVLVYQRRTIPVQRPSFRTGLFGSGERPSVAIHAFGRAELADVEPQITAALERVLAACDVEAIWAGSGGEGRCALFPHPFGDAEWVGCSSCDYAALRSWATITWPKPSDEDELPLIEIATPGCDTIATLADFLDIPATRTLKMVFYSVQGKVTCAVIRGDRTVDEAKLARELGTDSYYVSLESELAAIGAVGGYASPLGLASDRVRVVADLSARSGVNFVSGANRAGFHIRNVNIPRDFAPDAWADLALTESGDPCPRCGASIDVREAFELARCTRPAQLDADYLDEEGRAQPLWWASWRLDVGRLLAAVVETHHDDHGIRWPSVCAPFDVHLVALDLRKEVVAGLAQALYKRLRAKGFAVLYDDRDASPGVKFNDADLIGVPLRLTVSRHSAASGLVEAKWRDSQARLKVDDDGLAGELARLRMTGLPRESEQT